MSGRLYRAYNLAAVAGRRDALFDHGLARFVDTVPHGDAFIELVAAVRARLPGGIGYDAVFESVRAVAGQPLTRRVAYNLAWRLAGNIQRLRAGQPVTPWTTQAADEWVPLQILSARPARNRRGDPGTEFGFLVLAGTSCPLRLTHFWRNAVARLAARTTGFSRRTGRYPFTKPTELVGLRLYGHVLAQRSQQLPFFYTVDCPASLRQWNRRNVLNLRFRVGKTCPNGWVHPCHQCAVGYETCPAGTHYRTYQRGCCDRCGTRDAVFDIDVSTVHCRACSLGDHLRGGDHG